MQLLRATDIYKIYQSGDLANLDGLDDSSLSLLPSLLDLRNALYSSEFREYLSTVTGAGPLSGKKTDMAINVYTPGCHLLCHDDVIGSRRVSYILYLTNPDKPWQKEWGGALRLYPTETITSETGENLKSPSPDWSVSIPPAFNQLSFFAVQPGESFHDVEEVFAREESSPSSAPDEDRIRTAISGWYHIPQEGELGYEAGMAENLALKSSLVQLQGNTHELDLPQPQVQFYVDEETASEEDYIPPKAPSPSSSPIDSTPTFTVSDLNHLVKYIAPTYLTPDALEDLADLFLSESSLRLSHFLSAQFSAKLKSYISSLEDHSLPKTPSWTQSRPPHKHSFLYLQPSTDTYSKANAITSTEDNPLKDLLENLFPSSSFRKWLAIATGLTLTSHNLLARRFPRGRGYTLATGYGGEDDGQADSRLELTLGITPSLGWGDDEDEDGDESEEEGEGKGEGDREKNGDGERVSEGGLLGGYEMYMVGDEDEDSQKHSNSKAETSNGDDAAVYKSTVDGADDGVLFTMAAGWNRLSIVLRDRGVLKFVKYVSAAAKGDRWDVVGEFGVMDEGDDLEDDEERGD